MMELFWSMFVSLFLLPFLSELMLLLEGAG